MQESRKIIRFGKNSFVISIPKTWVNQNNLSKGDMVYIDQSQPELRIMPSENTVKIEIKKIIIETEEKSLQRIRNEITSAYLMNNNIIELVGENVTANINEIKSILRSLAGIEIMEVTAKRVTAHDILSEGDVDIANIMRRIDIICRSMITDSMQVLSARQAELAESVNARDADVNRLAYLAFRVLRKCMIEPQFAKKLGLGMLDISGYWNMISLLERIADQAKRVARHIINFKISKEGSERFAVLHESINELYLDIMKAYHTQNKALAFKVIDDCTTKNIECNAFLAAYPNLEVAHAIGFLKSMNSLIRHIARSVSAM